MSENQTGESQTSQPTPAPSDAVQDAASPAQETQPSQAGIFDSKQEKLYAGKFKSVEDLEKGYQEAQKLIGQRAQKQEESAPAADLSEIGKRFQSQLQTGQFDEDVSAALQQFGMSPESVRSAMQADRQGRRTKINEAIGQEVDWDSVNSWLIDNKKPEQIHALNTAVEAGLYGALKDVVAEFEAAGSSDDPPVVGESPKGPTGSGKGFASTEEAREFLKASRNLAKAGSAEEWQQRLGMTAPAVRKQLGK